MANGPKTAPIMAQNLVFAPLLSAICHRAIAHDMHIPEMIRIPVIIRNFAVFQVRSQNYVKHNILQAAK
jgi:hypothetical protein